jgi:hypothetical protein
MYETVLESNFPEYQSPSDHRRVETGHPIGLPMPDIIDLANRVKTENMVAVALSSAGINTLVALAEPAIENCMQTIGLEVTNPPGALPQFEIVLDGDTPTLRLTGLSLTFNPTELTQIKDVDIFEALSRVHDKYPNVTVTQLDLVNRTDPNTGRKTRLKLTQLSGNGTRPDGTVEPFSFHETVPTVLQRLAITSGPAYIPDIHGTIQERMSSLVRDLTAGPDQRQVEHLGMEIQAFPNPVLNHLVVSMQTAKVA